MDLGRAIIDAVLFRTQRASEFLYAAQPGAGHVPHRHAPRADRAIAGIDHLLCRGVRGWIGEQTYLSPATVRSLLLRSIRDGTDLGHDQQLLRVRRGANDMERLIAALHDAVSVRRGA